jgi:hypothetical protein
VRKPPRLGRWVSNETVAGDPVTAAGVTVTPLARTLAVRTPVGGLVWSRPVAVQVERDGRVRRIRIVDVTRAVQVGLLVSSLAAIVAVAALTKGVKDGGRDHEHPRNH